MRLRVLLPFQVFAEIEEVSSLVVQTPHGSFGLLPRRLDCVAPLCAGILSYQDGAGEHFLAVDQGVLVKTGPEVLVCVRHAIGGADLGQLRASVEEEFLHLDERETQLRSVMAKLESGLIHRFAEFHNS